MERDMFEVISESFTDGLKNFLYIKNGKEKLEQVL